MALSKKDMRILVTGLECSTTKAVAKLMAFTLGIEGADNYDGNNVCEDDNHLVKHLSMPHGAKGEDRGFPFVQMCDYSHVIVVTRDYFCSLASKIRVHENIVNQAFNEHEHGISILKEILKRPHAQVFSYESWFLLGERYASNFVKSLDPDLVLSEEITPIDCNSKHMGDGRTVISKVIDLKKDRLEHEKMNRELTKRYGG